MLSFYLIINLSKIKVKATQMKRQLLNKMAYFSGQFKLEIFHRWHYGASSAEPLAELVLLALAAAAEDPAKSKQLSQFRFCCLWGEGGTFSVDDKPSCWNECKLWCTYIVYSPATVAYS